MGFDLNAIKAAKENSGQFLDLNAALEKVLNEDFEEGLQKYLINQVNNGYDYGKLFLIFEVDNNELPKTNIIVESDNSMLLNRIANNLYVTNISNINKACVTLLDKLISLGLTVTMEFDDSMQGDKCDLVYATTTFPDDPNFMIKFKIDLSFNE